MENREGIIGYQGICGERGLYISIGDAYNYAMEHIWIDSRLYKEYSLAGLDREETVEWFFSGDFVRVYEEEI